MPPTFVHLRMHTEYSICDGITRIKEGVACAAQEQMGALAITDLNNLFGWIKFYQACRQQGIKPIVGCDVSMQRFGDEGSSHPSQLLLLCRNQVGYLNLCRLLTRMFVAAEPRTVVTVSWEDLIAHREGLLVLSGGVSGALGAAILAKQTAHIEAQVAFWQTYFPQCFYLEVQRVGHPNEEAYNQAVIALAQREQWPVVATHPIQFLHPKQFVAHDIKVCISEGKGLDDPRRQRRFSEQQYFKSTEEMRQLFSDMPGALENSVEIAKRCTVSLSLGQSFLPDFPIPGGLSVNDYFQGVARQGLQKRLGPQAQQERYKDRLEVEIKTITQMGYAGYFLIVQDFICWAKRNAVPVGPGRGSGAGSLVAFALEITDLDPLQYDLLFERFLNPERVSLPDFDIDFCQDTRHKVIAYVKERYGHDAVSQIVTFGTLAAKAAVRDVGRVLGLPYGLVDGVAKLIPFEPGKPVALANALKSEPALRQRYETEEEVRQCIDLAQQLEGITRNVGMHAGGVLIAPSALSNFCPLYRAEGSDDMISQYDKDDVEQVGLIKFDFLGLRTLTILDAAVRNIYQLDPDSSLDLSQLSLEDPACFKVLQEANTTAVFQLESAGIKQLLGKLKPTSFEDIIAVLALFRPGPLGSGMVDDFINRKHGRAKAEYFHPDLESVLKPTYGVIVYQEQVMLISQIIGGYSLGGADLLRRAMGKKKVDEMALHRVTFEQGAVARGYSKTLAQTLFNLMEKFAEYGFNKSHTAAYALLAYQTGWLKAHHLACFMAAVLSSDIDDTDKVRLLVEDAKRNGLSILPPDINQSFCFFVAVDAKTVRFGLGALKGLGTQVSKYIEDLRQKCGGAFKSIVQFCCEASPRMVRKRVVEVLIRAGAFDSLEPNRAFLAHNLESILAYAQHHQQFAQQAHLFGSTLMEPSADSFKRVPFWSERERLQEEKTVFGFFVSGHLFSHYLAEAMQYRSAGLANLLPSPEPGVFVGIITTIRFVKTRRGKMCLILLEDDESSVEVSIFSDVLARTDPAYLKIDALLTVGGRVTHDAYLDCSRVVAEWLLDETMSRRRFCRMMVLSLEPGCDVQALQALFKRYCRGGDLWVDALGGCAVRVCYENAWAQCCLDFSEQWQPCLTAEFLTQVRALLGEQQVKLVFSRDGNDR